MFFEKNNLLLLILTQYKKLIKIIFNSNKLLLAKNQIKTNIKQHNGLVQN